MGFQDHALEEMHNPCGPGFIYTGRVRQRLFLVLDCVTSHQFSEKGSELVNLQQYVTKVKKVPEKEAILIFYDIVRVVANLHKVFSFLSIIFNEFIIIIKCKNQYPKILRNHQLFNLSMAL